MYSIDTKQSAIQAFARMADLFNINYKLQNLFVHDHQALCVSIAGPDEVDAFLVLGSRDDQLRFFGNETVDLLAQCVVKAYHAKVLALEGYAFVGRIGEHGQRRTVFIDANGHLVNDVDLEVARRGMARSPTL